jgi:hypothetical protein
VASDFTFTPANVYYDGRPHSVAVAPIASVASKMGAISSVRYQNVSTTDPPTTTPPTEIGAYYIIIDVAAAYYYDVATDLNIGIFVIGEGPYAMRGNTSSLDFGSYRDDYSWVSSLIAEIVNTGFNPLYLTYSLDEGKAFRIVGVPNNIITLGGKIPVEIEPLLNLPSGIYIDTLRIRDSHGVVISIGLRLLIQMYAPPRPIIRTVTLPIIEGAKTDPLGGWSYRIESRDNFVFKIIPDEGYTLENVKVTTGLPWRDNEWDIVLTYNDDGTVKVTLRVVNEDVDVTISGVRLRNGVGNDPVSEVSVWGNSGSLHVVTPQPAQVQVYSVLGTLGISQNVSAGETVFPLQKGIYIVRIGDVVRKVVVR